jgi:hypothetical protein
MIIVSIGYHAEILIEGPMMDRFSASPGAGRKRRRRRRATPSCHELKMQGVISTNKLKK